MSQGPMSQKGLWRDVAIAAALFLIVVAAFARVVFRTGQLAYHGDIIYSYGLEIIIRQSYAREEWPLWNPYEGIGSPALGQLTTYAVYPPDLILRWLPVPAYFNWSGIGHVWLAGLGMYFLLRDLEARRSPSALSAIGFMLSGAMIPRFVGGHTNIVQGVAWAPWILLLYRRLLSRVTFRHYAATSIVMAFLILGAHPQFTAMVLLITIGYFLLFVCTHLWQRDWTSLARTLGISILLFWTTAGLTAIQTLPFIEWFQRATRQVGVTFAEASARALEIPHLGTMAVPLLWFDAQTSTCLAFRYFWELSPFVGLLTLWLAVIGLLSPVTQRRREAIFLAALAGIGMLLALGDATPLYDFVYRVAPFFRQPGRYLMLWVFSVSALGGLGLESLVKNAESDRMARLISGFYYLFLAALVAVLLGVACWGIFGERIVANIQSLGYFTWLDASLLSSVEWRNVILLVIPTLSGFGLLWMFRRKMVPIALWSWLVTLALLAEMLVFACQVLAPYPVSNLFDPQSPATQLTIDASRYRLYQEGPVMINYLIPTVHIWQGELASQGRVRSLGMEGGRGSQLMAAGYFITAEPVDEPGIDLERQNGSAYLYRYSNTLPRIYAAPAIEVVNTDDEAFDLIAADSFDPYARAVVTATEGAPDLPETPGDPPAFSAEDLIYTNNALAARVTTDQPVMVVFSEMYYPGWAATVDGLPAPLWKVNYTFRGVIVEAGEHVIEMEFASPSFQLGKSITAVTLALMAAVGIALAICRRCAVDHAKRCKWLLG